MAHDDGVALSRFFEMRKIYGEMPGHLVVFANDTLCGHCCNERNHERPYQ